MELSVLKNFMRMNVDVLVGGMWINGNLASIDKGGVITLMPVGTDQEFYGPTALKAEAVQAIRKVKAPASNVFENPPLPESVQSAFHPSMPGNRAKIVGQ